MSSFKVKITPSGHFRKAEKWFNKAKQAKFLEHLEAYGEAGVQALSSATPVRSGTTASSWSYKITSAKGSASIVWTNSNVNEGVPIAIIIQFGHGTGTGGYVPPVDYINPAMTPIFKEIEDNIREEVANL